MTEKESLAVLIDRLEGVKEQIKNLVIERDSLQSICVFYKENIQAKYETLSSSPQLLQDYQNHLKRETVITYLEQYMKVFFPYSASIEIRDFYEHTEVWYRIIAIIDNKDIILDIPTYKEEYTLDASHYAYRLFVDMWYQTSFNPTELIQHEEK